jgi:hypothetical protein
MNATQEVMNRTASRASKLKHGETVTSRQSKSRLSRMNSKMSLVSSKKKGPGAGLKLKIDELNKQVQEMRLNVDKNLEDIRVMKNTEISRKSRFEEMEEIVHFLQKSHDVWNENHEVIKYKQEAINQEHSEGMRKIQEVHEKVQTIYKDTQKIISLFRKEYKSGFERIVRCEVQLGEVNFSFKFSIQTTSKYFNRRRRRPC